MLFSRNVLIGTQIGQDPHTDSTGPNLGKSATGAIHSDSFLSAPDLHSGNIQILIHGKHAELTAPKGNVEVIIQGDWNRTIKQYENIHIGRNGIHEHDKAVYSEFGAPGFIINNYLNADVRFYYLNGHNLQINQTVTEEIGLGSDGQEVILDSVRFGNDTIVVRAWSKEDSVTIHGDSASVQVGDNFSWHAGTATTIAAGAHFENYRDTPWNNYDQAQSLSALHGKEATALRGGLSGIGSTYSHGFKGLDPSDPNKIPEWNTPASYNLPQVKTLLFGGANLNAKLTTEFTFATIRAAFSNFAGGARAFDNFMNGWDGVFRGIHAGWDSLHANFAALCGRVFGFGAGNPRAAVPSPPTLSELELASEAAEAAAGGAEAAETATAAQTAADAATAESAVDAATADIASADTTATETAPELPEYNGKTSGVLVPEEPPGPPVQLESGPRSGAKFPFSQADGHVETKGANWMAEKRVTKATLYHNNPNGTCGNCDYYLPTYLENGSVLRVVPPEDAVAPTPRWIDVPKTYTGNAKSPY